MIAAKEDVITTCLTVGALRLMARRIPTVPLIAVCYFWQTNKSVGIRLNMSFCNQRDTNIIYTYPDRDIRFDYYQL